MYGGELATDGAMAYDLLDGRPHFLHALNALVLEYQVDSILALVALCSASSTVLQDLQQDVDIQLFSAQCLITHEKKRLRRREEILGLVVT